jgi:hypothetical protein
MARFPVEKLEFSTNGAPSLIFKAWLEILEKTQFDKKLLLSGLYAKNY